MNYRLIKQLDNELKIIFSKLFLHINYIVVS